MRGLLYESKNGVVGGLFAVAMGASLAAELEGRFAQGLTVSAKTVVSVALLLVSFAELFEY
jgi:hypothetical protein